MRNVRGVGGGQTPKDWFNQMPPVSKFLLVAVVLITCCTSFKLLTPFQLHLDYFYLSEKFQIWRLLTCMLYGGDFSLGFIFFLFILISYSLRYEKNSFDTGGGGGSSDYAYMLLLSLIVFIPLGLIFKIPFFSNALSFEIMYVWSRESPHDLASFFGFKFERVYLPFILLGFNLLIGNSVFLPLLGIFVGHLYVFLVQTLPNRIGKDFILTPIWLINFIDSLDSAPTQAYQGVPPNAQYPSRPGINPNGRGHSWGSGRVLGGNN